MCYITYTIFFRTRHLFTGNISGRSYYGMEARRNDAIAPIIMRIKDMRMSLDFYTKPLGFRSSDKISFRDGELVHASIGFDSPLLMLTPVEHVRPAQTTDTSAKKKLGAGVELSIGINGSKKLDTFFKEVKAKGITVINELHAVKVFRNLLTPN